MLFGANRQVHTSLFYPLRFSSPVLVPIATATDGTDTVHLWFLPERDYVTFGSLLSQFRRSSVCLSVVCNIGAPYPGLEPFGNISSPLYTLAILWPPCRILRRSSQGNPSIRSVKRKRGVVRVTWPKLFFTPHEISSERLKLQTSNLAK